MQSIPHSLSDLLEVRVGEPDVAGRLAVFPLFGPAPRLEYVSFAEARAAGAAVRYPPHGVRGVGSALARAARWNRSPEYLQRADETITLLVQIETALAVENVAEIAGTEGVHGIFLGPSDLAASMGHLGQQEHPEVVAAVEHCIAVANELGVPVGVNAFAEATARRYLAAGVDFILVGADVALLARGSEALAAKYLPEEGTGQVAASY